MTPFLLIDAPREALHAAWSAWCADIPMSWLTRTDDDIAELCEELDDDNLFD